MNLLNLAMVQYTIWLHYFATSTNEALVTALSNTKCTHANLGLHPHMNINPPVTEIMSAVTLYLCNEKVFQNISFQTPYVYDSL